MNLISNIGQLSVLSSSGIFGVVPDGSDTLKSAAKTRLSSSSTSIASAEVAAPKRDFPLRSEVEPLLDAMLNYGLKVIITFSWIIMIM